MEIDLDTVMVWLAPHLGSEDGVRLLAARQPGTGFSAKTVLLTVGFTQGGRAQTKGVAVRVEQPGHDLFLDTSIVRQGEMMRGLAARGIAAPEVIGIETDRSVLGGQFLVTAGIEGQALPQYPSYQVAGLLHDLPPAGRYEMWSDAVRQIGRINRLDWREGFGFLNRPGFGAAGLAQYLGWLEAWAAETVGGRVHAVLEFGLNYLRVNRPRDVVAADVLWGDSNAGNMLFTPAGRVAAVLDFEAAAIGPGEIDLGWWFYMDDMLSVGTTKLAGLPSREEQISLYEETMGRRVRELGYYEILAGVRMALVMVRTVDRLVNFGVLAGTTRAAFANPIVEVLAGYLGIGCEPSGADYGAMVTAMNTR